MDAVTDKVETAANEHLVLDMVDKFLATEVKPHVHALEHDDVYPAAIVEKMKEMGLFGCVIASEYGGLGLSTSTYAKIIEQISAVWMSISGIINSHLIMAMVVQRNCTEQQKAAFLPRFATGELRGGVGLTEPACGTDLQAIRTTAKRAGDEYVVNGRKTWITNSLYGNCLALLVKTDPDAKPRHRGMSLLIAEKGPGFTVNRKLDKLGYRARTRAHQRRRSRCGDRRCGAQGGCRLCASAQDFRQADLRASGDPAQARRHGDAS